MDLNRIAALWLLLFVIDEAFGMGIASQSIPRRVGQTRRDHEAAKREQLRTSYTVCIFIDSVFIVSHYESHQAVRKLASGTVYVDLGAWTIYYLQFKMFHHVYLNCRGPYNV